MTTTLLVSYFVAMLVTPILCMWLLTGETAQHSARGERALASYDNAIAWCLERPGTVVAGAGVAFLLSLMLIPAIGSQFFPAGARDQFFIKVWLPESSPIAKTSDIARQVEAVLLHASPAGESGVHRLANAVTYVGNGGPRLMLTQEPEYNYPYFAFILVNTLDDKYTDAYAAAVRASLANIGEARITVDQFMLGPPIKDPVAFRLTGADPQVIASKAREMVRLFKQTPGTVDPYDNWGAPAQQVDVEIDSYAANLAGVTNEDIALTTNAVLSGAVLTTYREGDHRVPIMLRTVREKRAALADLADIFVHGRFGKVPLNSIAHVTSSWQPAVIARRDGLPTVTVGRTCRIGVAGKHGCRQTPTKARPDAGVDARRLLYRTRRRARRDRQGANAGRPGRRNFHRAYAAGIDRSIQFTGQTRRHHVCFPLGHDWCFGRIVHHRLGDGVHGDVGTVSAGWHRD